MKVVLSSQCITNWKNKIELKAYLIALHTVCAVDKKVIAVCDTGKQQKQWW